LSTGVLSNVKRIIKKYSLSSTNSAVLVNSKDKSMNTPLHIATIRGHTDIVTYLIEKDADINAFSKFNWTPLHHAAKAGYEKCVLVLLEAGADRDLKTTNDSSDNCYAKTAAEIAQISNQTSTAKLIKDWAPNTARKGFFNKLDPVNIGRVAKEKKRSQGSISNGNDIPTLDTNKINTKGIPSHFYF